MEIGLGSVDSESPLMTKVFADLVIRQSEKLPIYPYDAPVLLHLSKAVTFSQNIGPVPLPETSSVINWTGITILLWRDPCRFPRFLRYGNFSTSEEFSHNNAEFSFSTGNYQDGFAICNPGDEGAPVIAYGDSLNGVLGGMAYACEPLKLDYYFHFYAVNIKNHLAFIKSALAFVID